MGCAAQEGEGESAEGGAGLIRLSPRTREVFDIFHFVNIRLEFKIQIFFILNQF